ncbi:superfamily I helicase [Cryptosporidium ubiquitum]|uniref:Superfamily I helicase n=1 Tax=Cryptosporidium ubiquitum TaxID=857276 RepID=A0A1J4MM95_9CRYT|nr:superfamily I helicase [Cryptosporidium ubiquitum]OII75302.1 superfamily I helicase [Cryptosporidium ubiquitum]
MNKKVEIISQTPHGIISCEKDPDIYNVCSFSSEHRIVDMLLFECTCPSKDKAFCSHIRAVSKKFQTRYNREIFNIYSILNDINIKNSFASCYDKAENHFNLFLKSINKLFHFNNFLENQDLFSLEAKQRYKRVLYAILKALSSISWRNHLIKTKDSNFINSINYANNARNSIKVDLLLNSINFSLSNIKREDFPTVIEFLKAIESNSLQEIGIFNTTSIFNILASILNEKKISNANKEILISGILELFCSNNFYLQFQEKKIEKKYNGFDCKFLNTIIKTIKRYVNYIDTKLTRESVNFILMEEFGLDLDFLGISERDIIREISLLKNNAMQNTRVVDLLSLKIHQIDLFISNSKDPLNNNFFTNYNLINVIHSAPILIDLYDYLFWYSASNHIKFGELTEFLENNIDNELLGHFYFVKFSKSGNRHKLINSMLTNNQICIYKVSKPNNEKYSATHVYYSFMIDSINQCDGIKTLNYFLGGCIQENGIDYFVKLFPKEILMNDISSRIHKSFNLIDFFSCILKLCPPILYVDLWDYILITILSALKVEKDQFIMSLYRFFVNNSNIFELNKLIHIIPLQMKSDFYFEAYNSSLCLPELSGNEDDGLKENNESKQEELFLKNEFSSEDLICNYCLSLKPKNLIDCESFIRSIQRQRFGISDNIQDNDYNRIIENYTRIINQSCKNLSIKLYTKTDHFIFELIQNADDNHYCSCIGRIPSIIFAFHKNGVLVINNEVGFTEKDVSSICDIGNSSKNQNEKTIGCFGIGFKSVFSITNTPFIFSNGYCFMFNLNSEHGSYIFPEWVDDELCNLIPLHKFHNEYDKEISTYRTKFWFPFKKNIDFEDVKLNENIILFTNKIKRIKLITNNRVSLITRNDQLISSDVVLVNILNEIIYDECPSKKRKLSFNKNRTKSFLIVNHNFKVPKNISNLANTKKSNTISIGIEINNELDSFDGECDCGNKEIFSFLPIRSYGLKFIIQADFDLTSSRESISVDSNWNIYIRENIPNAFIHMLSKLREISGFHLLKKSFLSILPTRTDNIDEFFLPIISKINQVLIYEKCIYTYERTFTQPSNSVYINKNSKVNEILIHIFPNTNEFSYLLNKYSNKFLICNIFTSNTENVLFEDLRISEFNINMLIDLISGIILDYSYFGRSYEWYFSLFLLIEHLMNTSDDINSNLRKLQRLPLFLTEEGRYIESINIDSSNKQLFLMDENLPSISKLGIHFIKKEFIFQLKEFYKDELINYNKVISFIQSLGPYFLKNDEYYEIISKSLTYNNLSIDDHILFTYLLAKSEYISNNNEQIFAINSSDEMLPLTARNFHLFNKSEKYSIIESAYKMIDNQSRNLINDLSYNTFSKKYLHHADESFWNSFFRKFGITILPFYFEKIQFNNLIDYKEFLKSVSKLDNNKLIDQHIESIYNIKNSNQIMITDFYCHGIESLAIIMSDTLTKHTGNKYFEELLTTISNQIIHCICDFWEEIQIYWSITIHEIIKKPSFVHFQFSSYPIFISKYLFNNNFIFQQLCPPKSLTLYVKTQHHEVISKFVNFLILDVPEKSSLITLSDAFSSRIEINLDYLCLLVEALNNPKDKISLYNKNQIDPNSYILLLELIIKESRSNFSISSINLLKKNLMVPLQDESKDFVWKSIQDLYWNDENILPKNYSLLYQFSVIHKLSISINEIMSFFLILGVPIKPEKKHLITHLLEIYKIERIEVDSKILLTYVGIITQLYKIDRTILNDLLKLPVVKKNYCRWLDMNLINDCHLIFSDSALFHYFIYKKLFSIKKVIWSPMLFTFIQSNLSSENQDLDALIYNWNIFCSQLSPNLENNNYFNIPSENHCNLDSSFYYEIIVNLFGPLYEESIKNQIKIRKNWSQLISKSNIIILSSDISIRCLEKTLCIPGIFDIKTNKLYVKHQNNLGNDDIEEILLSILTFISSFFPKNYPNIKSLMVTKLIFKDAIKEFESSKNNMAWERFIINWIQKIETEIFGFKIDLKYFLFSDYVDCSAFQLSKNAQINEGLQIEYNTNCPKKVILDIGKMGEELAFEYLKENFNKETGVSEFNIIWVNENVESGLPYDIVLVFIDEKSETKEEIFVEVKSSSKKEKNFFFISFNEWKFAEKLQNNYWLLHVLGVNCNSSKLSLNDLEYKIIRNPYESWRNGNLKMILSES